MTSINPKSKFVKNKISEQGENLAGSVLTTHNQQPRGAFPCSDLYNVVSIPEEVQKTLQKDVLGALKGDSPPSVDINLNSDQKNGPGRIADIDEGENAPLGSKKLEFWRGKKGVGTSLDTSSEISRQRKGQKRAKTGVLSVSQYELRGGNCGKYVREFKTKCCDKTYYTNMPCGLRTCPFCSREKMLDRTRKVVNFTKTLNANRKKYGHRLRFITFGYGTKNGIKKGVEKSLKAFELIRRNLLETQKNKDKKKTEGCVWSVELGSENLSVHIHVLYWGKYIPQKVLSNEWKRLTGKFYVDIRYAKNKSKKKKGLWGIVLETTKYVTKGLIDLDTATAFRIERELFNIRTFGTSGVFYGKIKPEKPMCPFCGSDEGFIYVGVQEKSRYVMTAIDIQRQFWEVL